MIPYDMFSKFLVNYK